MRRRRLIVFTLTMGLATSCATTPVLSPDRQTVIDRMDADEIERRIEFITDRLDANRTHASLYWFGWVSFYSGAVAVQSVRLGGVADTDTNPDAQRADLAGSIVRATGALAQFLIRPYHAMDGADPLRDLPQDSLQDRRAKLLAAETLLAKNARRARKRLSWARHAIVATVNLISAGVVAFGYDDLQRGLISLGIGVTVGEAMLLTEPWQPVSDEEDYRRFGAPPQDNSSVTWMLAPMPGGAGLSLRF